MKSEKAPSFHALDPSGAVNTIDSLAELATRYPVSRQHHPTYDDVVLVTSHAAASDVLQRRTDFSNRYGHSISPRPAEMPIRVQPHQPSAGARRRGGSPLRR